MDPDHPRNIAARGCGIRGYDAAKRIKGRKRHALVDTDGRALKLQVQVHEAAEAFLYTASAIILLRRLARWENRSRRTLRALCGLLAYAFMIEIRRS